MQCGPYRGLPVASLSVLSEAMKFRNISSRFLPLFLTFSLAVFTAPRADADVVTTMPLDIPAASSTKVGIYIADLQTGEQLYDVNTSARFIPASVTKSLTTASALTQRSATDRFATEIVATGKIDGSVIDGNLVVRCVGDPTIDSQYFDTTVGFADSIAAALVAMGINEIKGTVIIDESAVPHNGVPSGWVDEDIVWPYGTGHHGANFSDNTFIFSFPARTSQPHVPDLSVSHTPAKGALKVDRDRGSETIRTRGTARKQGESIKLSIPVPSKVMRHAVMKAISANGISVGESEAPASENETLVYTHYSPELIEILRSLMFRSDNMMAEAMLRSLAPGASRDAAARSELDMWELRDIDTDGIVIEDGSGLSRNDRLTPRFLAEVFVWMASHFKAPEYVSLFPRAGMEGTMKGFLRDTPLEGRIAFKTGSMKGVQSYAGFLLGNDGQPTHVIVVMVNNFTCGRAKLKEEIENLLLRTFAPGYERPKPEPRKKVAKKAPTKKTAKKAPAKKTPAKATKKKSTATKRK